MGKNKEFDLTSLKALPIENRKKIFPRLNNNLFECTSPNTTSYNCVAWSVGITDKWISDDYSYTWPSGIPKGFGLESYIEYFSIHGYEKCDNGSLEVGYKKIALYADNNNEFTHVALQKEDGTWTSKLGKYEDISHKSPQCLGGGYYGEVRLFMKCEKD